ncbi:MAG: 8-amino-7-oxononanoate synthase [Candidatus Margulisiibacteriota bacterium]
MDYDKFIFERTKDGALRILKPIASKNSVSIRIAGKEYIDFSSNDYLGLSRHPEMIQAATQAAEKYGTGSGGSRLLSGDSELFHELEDSTAKFKGKEVSLVFNSGYQANIGIISSLLSKEDTVFFDRLCHASIVDGIMMSGARFHRFKHNDTRQLEELLKKENTKKPLIITESVFSMDGDIAPLKELVKVKNKYGASLMVDEAHATGIFGKNGSGIVEELGLSDEVELIMGTFSKALGSCGAYIACSKKIRQYLINSCRSFIYSTALPPAVVACNLRSMELVKKEPQRRKKLLENAEYFGGILAEKGFVTPGCGGFKTRRYTQIIPLIMGENSRAISLSERLKASGIWALPIRYPTVPKGQARVRFSVNWGHMEQMLDKVIDVIASEAKQSIKSANETM